MKRVIQRKAKQGICDELLNGGNSSKKRKRASQDIGNKTKTSAAMLGLALSVGASGSLFSCHNKRAVAIEPLEKGITSVQGELNDSIVSTSSVEQSVGTVSYVIREGETLWSVADAYEISSSALAELNGFDDSVVLSVGQTVQVPSIPRVHQVSPVSPALVVAAVTGDLGGESQVTNFVATGSVVDDNLAQIQVENVPVGDLEYPDKQFSLRGVEYEDVVDLSEGLSSKVIVEAEAAVKPNADAIVHLDTPRTEDSQVSEPEVDLHGEQSSSLTESVLISVDRPLLVAESVAFSTIQEDGVSDPASSVQPVDESILTPEVSNVTTHQIQPGETLADIARHYGISTQQLASENGIRNPNRIFAGRVLTLPNGVQDGRVEVATTSTSYPAETVVPVGKISDYQSASQTIEQDFQSSQSAPGDVYVQRLLDEIEQMSSSSQVSSLDASPSVATPVAVASLTEEATSLGGGQGSSVQPLLSHSLTGEPLSMNAVPSNQVGPNSADAAATVVNPLFTPIETADSDSQVSPFQPEQVVSSEPQLVASAPLGAENYVPLSQPVTGRMVSPDLPPLLEPDDYLPSAPGQFNGYIYPAQGTLTSGYGWRWGRMHRGIDVAAPIGTPIVAAAPGVIEFAGWNSGGYGNMVDIRHPDGSRTRYAHNNRILVRSGQRVIQGEQIAEMGSTGYSTGPHVHFEIHLPDQGTVNPIAYLSR